MRMLICRREKVVKPMFIQPVEEEFPRAAVLQEKIWRMKFKEGVSIFCEFMNRDEIFLKLEGHAEYPGGQIEK